MKSMGRRQPTSEEAKGGGGRATGEEMEKPREEKTVDKLIARRQPKKRIGAMEAREAKGGRRATSQDMQKL